MKRNLIKEYRIRKFRKLYENFDDDLDAMSDEILKNDPYVDIDDEVDKKAKDIIDKEPGYFYHADEYGDNPKTFNTIDEWLDDKVIETELNPEFYFDGNAVKRLTGILKTITNLLDGLDTVRYLKKKIKEISNMNVLVAQQKLATALRKRIKEEGPKQIELLNKHKEQFKQFIENLKAYIEEDIKKCTGKKSYYVTYTISPKMTFQLTL